MSTLTHNINFDIDKRTQEALSHQKHKSRNNILTSWDQHGEEVIFQDQPPRRHNDFEQTS